jgi:hypothetical protein
MKKEKRKLVYWKAFIPILTVCYLISIQFKFVLTTTIAQNECDVSINERQLHSKKPLFSSNNYKVKFGLNVTNAKSKAIGYSIELYCESKSLSRMRKYYTIDLNEIPLEVNINSCPAISIINDYFALADSKSEYLEFRVNFDPLKALNFNSTMKMTLNRRLGDGCSKTLSFFSRNNSSLKLDYDYYSTNKSVFVLMYHDIKQAFVEHIKQLEKNDLCFIFLICVLVLILFTVLLACIYWLIGRKRRNLDLNTSVRLSGLRNGRNQPIDFDDLRKVRNNKAIKSSPIFIKKSDPNYIVQVEQASHANFNERAIDPLEKFESLKRINQTELHRILGKMSRKNSLGKNSFDKKANLIFRST